MTKAILLIHGIGNQPAGHSIADFVRGVFALRSEGGNLHGTDPGTKTPIIAWDNDDNMNVRRFVIDKDLAHSGGTHHLFERCHCYEFSWQQFATGHPFWRTLLWIIRLIVDLRTTTDSNLTCIRRFAGVLLLGAALLLVLAFIVQNIDLSSVFGLSATAALILTLFALLVSAIGVYVREVFVVPYLGDAYRYLVEDPANEQFAAGVRDQGTDFLSRLIDNPDITNPAEKAYSEIIIVGHSLGSIIALDIMRRTLKKRNQQFPLSPKSLVIMQDMDDAHSLGEYHGLQTSLRAEINQTQNIWPVSQFISLGSPLAYASVLLPGREPLSDRIQQGRVPTSPPVMEARVFAFQDMSTSQWFIKHTGIFGVTRWTNIYYPFSCPRVLVGDPVGGEIDAAMKPRSRVQMIKNVRIEGARPRGAHTKYWSHPEGLRKLRETIAST